MNGNINWTVKYKGEENHIVHILSISTWKKELCDIGQQGSCLHLSLKLLPSQTGLVWPVATLNGLPGLNSLANKHFPFIFSAS